MQIILGNHFNHNYTISFDLYYYSCQCSGLNVTGFIHLLPMIRPVTICDVSKKYHYSQGLNWFLTEPETIVCMCIERYFPYISFMLYYILCRCILFHSIFCYCLLDLSKTEV